MKQPIRIILVDDHQIIRDGLRVLLMHLPELMITGEASSGGELLALLKTNPADILIMDICLPGISGILLTEQIRKLYPEVKVIMLTAMTSEEFILNSLKAGAYGYLPKDVRQEELVEAILTVSEGKEYIARAISAKVLQKLVRYSRTPANERQENILSVRESEVLELFAEGYSYKEIADRLSISVRTVETHKEHIMDKLGLHSVADIVKYAIKQGYISI